MPPLLPAAGMRLRVLTTRLMRRLGFGEHGFLVPLAVIIGIVTAGAAVAFHELVTWIGHVLYRRADPNFLYGKGVALLILLPAAVMHKHLKAPLTPADHINTALSAGVGEIIEVAMAKRREDRYGSTEDMLEDLRLVRMGQQPVHARRQVDVHALGELEAKGKTVDLTPTTPPRPPVWTNPVFIVAACVAGASIIGNLIMLAILWK